MWNSDLHYNFIQKGAGKYEDSEDSEDSEESEESEVSSQRTESSQEETESLEPWSRYLMKPRNAMRLSSTH